MAAPQLIRNIVFDVGWVLVRLDYRPLLGFLQAHGAQLADRDAVMTRIRLEDHETGRLPGQGLLERLRALTRTQAASLEEMRAKWLDMFELEGTMVELAHRLSERYRVFLLSNIGDLHWAHLAREYRLHAIGHGALPSYVAGVMKPHPAIYAEAERRFALEPAATVFIDDRADNVATAHARGWRGVVHRDYSSTLSQLQRLGIG
jgi:HAD superfamily hydrolase (TIGR01509 family)